MATPKEAAVLWIRDKLYQGRKEFEFGAIDRVWLAGQIQAHYPHYELTDARLRKIAEAYKIEEGRIVKRLEKYLQTRGIKS
jgi:hypothetical protein